VDTCNDDVLRPISSFEEESVVGVGPEEAGSSKHRLILLDIRKGQRDTVIQVSKCPIYSLLGCYFDQLIPPSWDD